MLKLTRPLIALDTEWHAFEKPENAYIVEIGVVWVDLYRNIIDKWAELILPPEPITEEATAKHGITNEMVAGKPQWGEVAEKYSTLFRDCDFCGYNIDADLRIIRKEMIRVGVNWSSKGANLLDPFQIWRKKSPRSLSDAVRYFCGREPNQAHRADWDAFDALMVAFTQFHKYPDLPRDLKDIHRLCFDTDKLDPEGRLIWKNEEAIFNFGKHNGKSIREVIEIDRGYFVFLIKPKSDFSLEIKQIARDALNGIFPVKEVENERKDSEV